MSNILKKLEEATHKIEIEKKREYGTILTDEEIKLFFTVLKKEDFELKPLMESIEVMLQHLPEEKYMVKEQLIKDILKYYKLIENDDLLNIRHKLFFTDDKIMVKKPFFSPKNINVLKEKLQPIFNKV